jgi:hypothetical protein
MKIGISDQLAAQRAGRWHIALDDRHAGLPDEADHSQKKRAHDAPVLD